VEGIPITNKKQYVLHADMELLQECALMVGRKKLTAPENTIEVWKGL